MNKNQRHTLKKRRAEKIDEAITRLLDGEDVTDHLAWIKASATLLTAGRKFRLPDWAWASLVALVCLTIAGLLWITPRSKVNVMIRLETDALTLELAEPWLLDASLAVDQIRIEGLSQVMAPALGIGDQSDLRDAWLEARGGLISIDKLDVVPLETAPSGERGRIELRVYREDLELFSTGNRLVGELSVDHASRLQHGEQAHTAQSANPLDSPLPETIAFVSHGEGAAPTYLRFLPKKDWRVQGLKVRRLSFLQREVSASGTEVFNSAIKKGTITVYDVPSEDVELRQGDHLSLSGEVTAERLEISGGAEGIRLLFSGAVEQLKAGPERFEKNLAPTWLAYWYHNEPLAWFGSVVAFLWGLLWSIRHLLAPRA